MLPNVSQLDGFKYQTQETISILPRDSTLNGSSTPG